MLWLKWIWLINVNFTRFIQCQLLADLFWIAGFACVKWLEPVVSFWNALCFTLFITVVTHFNYLRPYVLQGLVNNFIFYNISAIAYFIVAWIFNKGNCKLLLSFTREWQNGFEVVSRVWKHLKMNRSQKLLLLLFYRFLLLFL